MRSYALDSITNLISRIEQLPDDELLPWMRQAKDFMGLAGFTKFPRMGGQVTVLSIALQRESSALLDLIEELHPLATYPDSWAHALAEAYRSSDNSPSQSAIERAFDVGHYEHAVRLDRWSRVAKAQYTSAELTWEEWVEVGHQRLRYWTFEEIRMGEEGSRGPGTPWEGIALKVLEALLSVAKDRHLAHPEQAAAWTVPDPEIQATVKSKHYAIHTLLKPEWLEQGWAAVAVERDAVGLFDRLFQGGLLGAPSSDTLMACLGQSLSLAFHHGSPHLAGYLVTRTPALDAPNAHGQRWGEVWEAWLKDPGHPMPWYGERETNLEKQTAFREQVLATLRERDLSQRPSAPSPRRPRRRS